eukprot:TRINITY_DN26449_c0_g1_i1.p1 TRINITY_DN26449_c0_g1~~TRINITY_DN26449_c0_g1_i1.p1  ORF type:complete len:652 (-),score=129.59 TRINITY_DN26449_c0_g1_i1:33-1988(-)
MSSGRKLDQVPSSRSLARKQEEVAPPPKVDNSWKNLTGANFRLQQEVFPDVDRSDWTDERKTLFEIFNRSFTDSCLSLVIVFSIVMLIVEVDQNAWRGKPEDPDYPLPDFWLVICNKVLVVFFSIEIFLRLYVYRRAFLVMGFGLDFLVVLIDLILAVLDLTINLDRVPQMTFLRVFRIMRLLRVRRVILQFPELCYLISGIASSVRAITWGVIMVYIMIVIWALIAVNLLHPIAREAALSNPACEDTCIHAFSSVWNAIVTLTQLLVFSDDWSSKAMPIIQQNRASFVFFLIAFSSVALAALNLILAAIVDSGAQAREEAAQARSEKQRQMHALEEMERTKYLLSLCQQLDYDDSGSLTLQELLNGFDTNKNFCKTMEELQLEKSDIEIFFTVVDKDGSGEVDYKEFLELVAQARRQASQQVLTFIKFALLDMRSTTKKDVDDLDRQVKDLKQLLLTKQTEAADPEEATRRPSLKEPHETAARERRSSVKVLNEPPATEKATRRPSSRTKEAHEQRLSKVQSRPSQKSLQQGARAASPPPDEKRPKHDPVELAYAMQVWPDEAPEVIQVSRRYTPAVDSTHDADDMPPVSFLDDNGQVVWLPEVQSTAGSFSSDMQSLLEEVGKIRSPFIGARREAEPSDDDDEIRSTRI